MISPKNFENTIFENLALVPDEGNRVGHLVTYISSDHYKWGAAETHLSIDFQFLVPPIITKIWENKHFESFQNRQKYRYSTIHVIIPPKFHRIVKLYSNLVVKFYYHQTFHLFLWVFGFMAFWSDDFFSKFVSIFTILAPRDSVTIFFLGISYFGNNDDH
jgi:hypothetical protein